VTAERTAEVPAGGRVVDAVLKLLDRQVLDPDGHMVCKVDDLELTVPADGSAPYVSAILSGPAALGPRLGGVLGNVFVTAQRVFHPDEHPPAARLDWGVVTGLDHSVHISLRYDEVAPYRLEAWVRDHVIARIPGASHHADQ
jgi:hypothetical protein